VTAPLLTNLRHDYQINGLGHQMSIMFFGKMDKKGELFDGDQVVVGMAQADPCSVLDLVAGV